MERGYQYGHLAVILSTTGNRDPPFREGQD